MISLQCVQYQIRKTLPEVSCDSFHVNPFTAKVCMKELDWILPFIGLDQGSDVTKHFGSNHEGVMTGGGKILSMWQEIVDFFIGKALIFKYATRICLGIKAMLS